MFNKTIFFGLIVIFVFNAQASDVTLDKTQKLTANLEALRSYKEGTRYLDLAQKDGLDQEQEETLKKQAFKAFLKAQEIDPQLFVAHYQVATMYKNGTGVQQDLNRAEMHIAKAILFAKGQDDKDKAKDLKHEIEAEKKIIAGKRAQAKYLADQGFEWLRKIENPVPGVSTEGFAGNALEALTKASVLDGNNFQVEYQLAQMYFDFTEITPDFSTAKAHAKRALKIAKDHNNEEFIADAQKLLNLIVLKGLKVDDDQDGAKRDNRRSRAASLFLGDGTSSSSSSTSSSETTTERTGTPKEKRKSIFDTLKPRSDSTSSK